MDCILILMRIHLRCKSLFQMAKTRHSSDVLQKPAWHPTALQPPTWSPEEKTVVGCCTGLEDMCTSGERLDIYGVVAEPGDVAFIAGVEQNGSIGLMPVFVSYKVPLFEGGVLEESKMINLQQIKIDQ